jgi:Uma2 family endonuclease
MLNRESRVDTPCLAGQNRWTSALEEPVMATLITDPLFEAALLQQRQAAGADRHDEVWEGVYWMAPQPNNEHQDLVAELTAILKINVDWKNHGRTLPGTNITDQPVDWTHNYRCPDAVVFLNETAAEDRDTHWLGGPDLAIEIVSQGDRTREKFDFYARVGTRELLVVDRFPWSLQLCRLQNERLELVAESTFENEAAVDSEIVPLSFQLCADEAGRQFVIRQQDGEQSWTIRV